MKKSVVHKKLVRLAACVLAAALIWSGAAVPARAAGGHFADVPATHWAYPYVERAYADGAVSGTGGDPAAGTGVFSPNSNMTYGQLLTMLTSAFYPEELAKMSKEGPWYAPAIRLTVERELYYLDESWLMEHAGSAINRYNASYIIVKILEDRGFHMPDKQAREAAARNISDWKQVGEDAAAWPYYVSTAVAAGVMSGVDSSGTFHGGGRITRASAAVIYTSMSQCIPRFSVTKGDGWSLIPDPAYWKEIEETFYTVYPRLWARWGGGVIQKHISVNAQEILKINSEREALMWTRSIRFDDVGHVWERDIEVSAKYKDGPVSPGFAHELGHVLQSYKKLDSSWWTESMASYARYRYYYYADEGALAKEPASYIQADDPGLRDWRFETSYYSFWFYAYMDSKYPTTPQGYGLLDSIHFAMRAGEITSDDPNDPNLNAVVKRITGFDTIEQLRQQYVRELDAGTWTFNGFAGYRDNYITENLPNVPNPTYPEVEGFNLCTGANTYSTSGESAPQYAASNLVDGDRSTRWEAARSDVTDPDSLWGGAQHKVLFSLGKAMTFNTYTLYHAGVQGENTRDWRISYYDEEKEQWIQFDEVHGNTQDVTTRTVKQLTAQSFWLEILDPGADGTVRLNELELYYNK